MDKSYGLFFSPHPDDVVLSSFSSLVGFSGRRIVITVFNSSKHWVWRFKAPTQFVTFWRTLEDKITLYLLGAKTIHLYWPDTSVRGETLIERPIWVRSRGWLPETIFSPLGVGGHLDHLCTRRVAVETWLRLGRRPQLAFYEDLPYAGLVTNVEEEEREILGELAKMCGELTIKHTPLTRTQMLRKIFACNLYASQRPPRWVLVARARQLGKLAGYDYAERVIVAQKDAQN